MAFLMMNSSTYRWPDVAFDVSDHINHGRIVVLSLFQRYCPRNISIIWSDTFAPFRWGCPSYCAQGKRTRR